MGLIHAEIALTNGEDGSLARRHVIGQDEVRQMTMTALVDTGACNLCLNEVIQEQPGFPGSGKTQSRNGRWPYC